MDISLVITTYNRAHLLDRSLGRLALLTPPTEILVIDDGGNDNTQQICEQWSQRDGLPEIRYVFNNNPGPSICSLARNIGVRMANYEWIATAEPELMFLSDVIAQFRELTVEHPIQVISSGYVYFGPSNWVPPPPQELGPPEGAEEAVGWVAPYTALWKKQWLAEVGGWDESFPGGWGWDDTDLLSRLSANGHGQFICRDIRAVHQYHGVGGDSNSINEHHFLAKSFHGGEDMTDVVANRGQEWGRLRT